MPANNVSPRASTAGAPPATDLARFSGDPHGTTIIDQPSPADAAGHDATDGPEFGPGGYLPERAAKRARKIVLRAPLGLQWIAGAVIAGILVVGAGAVFLSSAGGPPGSPYTELAPVAQLVHGEPRGSDGLVSLEAGRARVFHLEPGDEVAWCAPTRRFEAPDGRVWSATGRGLGTPSLREHPSIIVDDVLYVDWSGTILGPPPDPTPASPTC